VKKESIRRQRKKILEGQESLEIFLILPKPTLENSKPKDGEYKPHKRFYKDVVMLKVNLHFNIYSAVNKTKIAVIPKYGILHYAFYVGNLVCW
jgi:hypothetical protein